MFARINVSLNTLQNTSQATEQFRIQLKDKFGNRNTLGQKYYKKKTISLFCNLPYTSHVCYSPMFSKWALQQLYRIFVAKSSCKQS